MTDLTKRELCLAAIDAAKKSYAPYSGFNVGAALLCKNGIVYSGCNIENAAFSPTVCAERVAVFKAVSDGNLDFEMIAVVGGKNRNISPVTTPCGVCRQVLSEFCSPEMPILLVKNEIGDFEETNIGALLPSSFTL